MEFTNLPRLKTNSSLYIMGVVFFICGVVVAFSVLLFGETLFSKISNLSIVYLLLSIMFLIPVSGVVLMIVAETKGVSKYKNDLKELSIDALKAMSQSPEFTNAEKELIVLLLNTEAPGWSLSASL